jgi:uncharacterized protein (DUF302 family)
MRHCFVSFAAALVAGVLMAGGAATAKPDAKPAGQPVEQPAPESGIIRVKSAYGVDESIARIKADIAAKGIKFFDDIDQAALAAGAGIQLRPSHLLLFGNPPLGIQFLTANAYAGIDWPVRMLVLQDSSGQVWVAYTDFTYIARRHHIRDRDAQFKMAAMVAGSIAASVSGTAP